MSGLSNARPAVRTLSFRTLHTLLFAQSIIIVFASANRLTDFTTGYVHPNEFLRWVDLLNMLVFPLVSVLVNWLLKQHIETASTIAPRARQATLWNLTFLIGVYLLAASYGTHEVTNYLHTRFCADGATNTLCAIIIFHDDEFSHYIFFIGFTIINALLIVIQAALPYQLPLHPIDYGLLLFNALFISLGIAANLAFEAIGFDMIVVVALTLCAVGLLWRVGRQPLLVYYSVAYTVGLVLTVLIRFFQT